MRKALYLSLGLLLSFQAARGDDKKPASPQVERGRELFLNSPKGTACGTCHSMAGLGTAVGPNLTTLASVVGPRGMASAIRMTVTEYVQEVKTASGTFPGMQKEKQGDDVQMWDLSQTPPALRKLNAKQIVSTKQNQTWKHPPASAGYTTQELADIIGFLKWAATGSEKEISASEIGEQ
jgi:mono/diheme cytochrome c family protein